MHRKIAIILCTITFFIQAISGQCIGTANAYGYEVSWGTGPLPAAPCTWSTSYDSTPIIEWAYAPASTLAASNGLGLAISSASSRIPSGVSVISENGYEGALAVGGALPYLGTAALEGIFPTAGIGGIAYSCGNGAVGIATEDIDAYGLPEISTGTAIYGSGIGYGPCGYSIFY